MDYCARSDFHENFSFGWSVINVYMHSTQTHTHANKQTYAWILKFCIGTTENIRNEMRLPIECRVHLRLFTARFLAADVSPHFVAHTHTRETLLLRTVNHHLRCCIYLITVDRKTIQSDRRRQRAKLNTKKSRKTVLPATNTVTKFQITIFNKCRNAIVEYIQLPLYRRPYRLKR